MLKTDRQLVRPSSEEPLDPEALLEIARDGDAIGVVADTLVLEGLHEIELAKLQRHRLREGDHLDVLRDVRQHPNLTARETDDSQATWLL